MTGYTRNDTSNNISFGNIVNASDLDGEFDAIQAAFDATSGHTHDGSVGGGAPITAIGPAQDLVVGPATVTPKSTNTYDLGSTVAQWKDLYLDGTAIVDNLQVDENATVTGNITVNGNTTLGNATTDTVTVTAEIASNLIPSADDTRDLGSSTKEWKDLWIDGTANIDNLSADAATLGSLVVNSDTFRLSTAKTPASPTDTGTAGQIAWDTDFLYVCTATNTWKRTPLSGAIKQFSTRANFVSALSSLSSEANGSLVSAGGLLYVRNSSSTVISDLNGWEPFGLVTPEHFATNTTPGTTDMSSAFNAAIAAYNHVYIRPGTYFVGSGITISTTTGKTLEGAGSNVVNITTNNATADIITITAPGSDRPRGVKVSGIRVSNTAATPTAGSHFRLLKMALFCNFDDIRLTNVFRGFHLQGAQKCVFTRIMSNEQSTTASGFAVFHFDSTSSSFQNTEVYISNSDFFGLRADMSAPGITHGIYVNQCDGIFLTNVHIFEMVNGITLNPDEATNSWEEPLASFKAANLYVDTCSGIGINILGNATRYRGLNFTETYVRAARGTAGVYINAAVEDITFTGGKIYGNTRSGILTGVAGASGNAKNLIVTGVQFSDNNSANSSANGDIVWRGRGGNITGCNFVGGGIAGYAILFGADSLNSETSNCNTSAATSLGVVDNGTNNWIDGTQYGTNANGFYWRDKNGNLECWGSIASSSSADTTWTYPLAFKTGTVPVVNGSSANLAGPTTAIFNLSGAPTATSVAFNVFNTSAARQAVTARLRAIGRWK